MRLKPYFTITLFLTAMLLVGCNQQDTSLNAPEIASVSLAPGGDPGKPGGGGGGGELATFAVTFSGEVSNATGEPHEWTRKLKAGGNIITTDPHAHITLNLDLKFAKDKVCFQSGPYIGPLLIGEAKKNEPGSAKAGFWFEANDVSYQLKMFGDFDDGPWLPDVGNENLVTLSAWELETENNKVKNACTDVGEFSTTTTVLVERLEL